MAISGQATDANLTGHVVDKKTNEHLGYVNIFLKGTQLASQTDITGHFFLKNLPLGKQVIEVSFVGYKTMQKEIYLLPGKTLELNFEIEQDVFELSSVLISTSRSQTIKLASPNLVSMLTSELFAQTNSTTLAQGLSFQPGLRVETNCQNCGYQQVRINGLDGTYSQLLIDGRSLMSSLTSVYGIEQIPSNMIDRVEVMRGGGTALAGANAIGGTVNVITKEPLRNSGEAAHTTTFIGGKSADMNTSFNLSLVSDDHKSGAYVFSSFRNRESYDADKDGYSEIGLLNGKTIGMRAYYRPSNQSKLSVEYHNMGEFRRGGDSLDLAPHNANLAEQLEHEINGGGVRYDLFSKDYKHKININLAGQHAKRKSYFGANQHAGGYGRTLDKVLSLGGQYIYNLDNLIFMPAEITAGVDYNYNYLHDEIKAYNKDLIQKIYVSTAYFQNEWKNDKFSMLLGARLDKHNLLSGAILSPRGNFRYTANENFIFRATYSQGFRAPQAYNEDLHISLAGGRPVLIELSPDLKAEKSQSVSLSVDMYRDFGQVKTNLLIEGFVTDIDNLFVLKEKGSDNFGNTIMERINASGAMVKGINFEARIVPIANLEFQAGMTIQRSKYNEAHQWSDNEDVPKENRLFRSPNHYAYLTSSYRPTKSLMLAVSGTYTGSMLVQHLEGVILQDIAVNTPSFFDLNLNLSYDIIISKSITTQLNTGIQNIFNAYQNDFDKGASRDANYIYGPSLPRSFNLGFKILL
ncbi:TonB-dependent receptor [Bacteroidales bacterium]|nr:TonB-dependent receptor [Bacteroidales bacterium]